MMKLSKNTFSKGLFLLLIFSLIFGNYGGAFQPIRIISLAIFPFTIYSMFVSGLKFSNSIIFFGIFISLGLFLIFFSENMFFALKDVLYLLVNLTLWINIVVLLKQINLSTLELSKYLSFLFVFLVFSGIIEILTGLHFNNSVFIDNSVLGGVGIERIYASFTFGNYNYFNVHLLFLLPFSINFYLKSKFGIFKFIVFLAIILAIIIFIVNASRGSILGGFILLMFLFFKIKNNYIKFSIILVPLIIYMFLDYEFITFQIFYRLSSLDFFSDDARGDIINVGIKILIDSNFIGVGPGNFEESISLVDSNIVAAPHNILLEVVTQYGILGLIIFFCIFLNSFRRVFSNTLLRSILYIFPFFSIINSTYLDGVLLWLLFAMCDYICLEENHLQSVS
jgi:teichuronic acid biosynthesis protein TuaE